MYVMSERSYILPLGRRSSVRRSVWPATERNAEGTADGRACRSDRAGGRAGPAADRFLVAPAAPRGPDRLRRRALLVGLAGAVHALAAVPPGAARLLRHHLGGRPLLSRGPGHPRRMPGLLAGGEP